MFNPQTAAVMRDPMKSSIVNQYLNNPQQLRQLFNDPKQLHQVLSMVGLTKNKPTQTNQTNTTTEIRSPKVIYATQLQELHNMGFTNDDQCIDALQHTGGSIDGAIEFMFQ